MIDPLYEQVIVWGGLALLLLLSLPLTRLQKLVLEVYALALRLTLFALLAAAAYLWLYPQNLPAEVTQTLSRYPNVGAILPEPGTPTFGVCAASLLVIILLPLMAILDVSRKLAGWRLSRLRTLAAEPKVVVSPPAPEVHAAPAVRRVDRRGAADALAQAGSHPPVRVVSQREQ
jgi:hypothetical protein